MFATLGTQDILFCVAAGAGLGVAVGVLVGLPPRRTLRGEPEAQAGQRGVRGSPEPGLAALALLFTLFGALSGGRGGSGSGKGGGNGSA